MSDYIFVVSTAGMVIRTKVDKEVLEGDDDDLLALVIDTMRDAIKVHEDIDVDVDDVGFIGFVSNEEGIAPLDLTQAMMVARSSGRGLQG